jgi:hypothetical protein
MCRRLAREPAVEAIVEDERWDRPLQLLGGLHYLALSEGADSWNDPVSVLEAVVRSRWDGPGGGDWKEQSMHRSRSTLARLRQCYDVSEQILTSQGS